MGNMGIKLGLITLLLAGTLFFTGIAFAAHPKASEQADPGKKGTCSCCTCSCCK